MKASLLNSTAPNERIEFLDVSRGFAILGIFMVNILVMNCGFTFRGEWEIEQFGWLNDVSFFVLETFFFSKFFTIFSFLFGVGLALQIKRMKEKGAFKFSFFARRLLVLYFFGALHVLLIWSGDILNLYAFVGLVVVLLANSSIRTQLIAAGVVYLFPYFTEVLLWFFSQIGFNASAPLEAISREGMIELKRNGSYISGVILRMKEYAFALPLLFTGIGPISLAMALLGSVLVKSGMLFDLEKTVKRILVPSIIILVVLLSYRFILLYYIQPNFDIEYGSILSFYLMTFFLLSDMALGLFYLLLLYFCLRSKLLRKMVRPLRHVGRMALTNYISQSIIGYFIMRVLGYYETFSPAECIMLVIVIFTAQIFISKLWLSKFAFGPLEWVWRCLSYGKRFSLR